MKQTIHRDDSDERRHFVPSKKPTVVLHPHLLYAGMLKQAPKWNEKPHTHPFLEVLFIKSGHGTTTIDGKNYEVRCGDLVIYNPNVTHKDKSHPDDPPVVYFFGVRNISLTGLPENCLLSEDAEKIIHTGDNFELFDRYFSDLIAETSIEQYFSKEIAELITRMLLLLILRMQTHDSETFVKVNDLFRKAKLYIDKNYAEITGIDDICKNVYISKYYLIHLFKEYTDKTPMQYVLQKKLDIAKKLLSTTTLPIYSIALRAGYEDSNYFCKVFKRLEHLTPLEYRRIYS
jgi:AraC-like DNA-binding protein/mannose-6-phosphate isomerase-like protein (cupin superfamily)